MSAPRTPTPPPVPAAPPLAPTEISPDVLSARDAEKRAQKAASGRGGTIKTSSDLQQSEPNTATKVLLG